VVSKVRWRYDSHFLRKSSILKLHKYLIRCMMLTFKLFNRRIKKGARVYAMYPQTTSLYPATVIDSTTYCRGDDDITVVEFDGEESGKFNKVACWNVRLFSPYQTHSVLSSPDATGQVAKYHIPARFVTLVPREFSASQASLAANKNKRKGAPLTPGSTPPGKREKKNEDFLLMDFEGGDFDALDLDFDAPLEDDEETDADFPSLM
jgi:hypothetical protein